VLAGGKGWGDEDLAGLARALGVSDRVILPGYIPRPLLSALYGGAAALAMPSLYEGFGLPVVEAMACGAPVLCSNSSSLPEAAGGAAFLVDPLSVPDIAAGLRQLLEDAALGVVLRERGLARAALLTWEASARQVFQALTEVADGR
jgi:glycosyltransferase involved in cell wall biosynthesis